MSRVIEGVDLGFTFLPERLKTKGYATHHVGKWHQGVADFRYSPTARGFDTTLGFFGGQEDHFTQQQTPITGDCGAGIPIYDIWENGQPARQLAGKSSSDRLWSQRAVEIINNHATQNSKKPAGTGSPLFLYVAFNTPHSPLQAEQKYLDLYPDISYQLEKTFYAMVSTQDDAVADIVTALKSTGLWDNTVFVWQGDNGGVVGPQPGGVAGIPSGPGGLLWENWRGGKGSNFEGGIRVPTLVNGGLLPNSQRGKSLRGIGHISDWYATFLTLAGIDPTDYNHYSPSPIDSINIWPWISGQVAVSPRTTAVFDHNFLPNQGPPAFGAIRKNNYKLLVGPQSLASWYGGPENNYFSPNQSVPQPDQSVTACSYTNPCLFDLSIDPTEHNDISAAYPSITAELLKDFQSYDSAYHIPNTFPTLDGKAYCAQLQHNGYVVAPYLNSVDQIIYAPTSSPTNIPTTPKPTEKDEYSSPSEKRYTDNSNHQ